jgi:hypothetical protein
LKFGKSTMRIRAYWLGIWALLFSGLAGCSQGSDGEGSPALKLFSALGVSLVIVILIFYIVVRIREKE